MVEVFVRKATSVKNGRSYFALVVSYGTNHDGTKREKLFFDNAATFMSLLDLKPSELYDLADGDYAIVEQG